jgi:hypothetical protein
MNEMTCIPRHWHVDKFGWAEFGHQSVDEFAGRYTELALIGGVDFVVQFVAQVAAQYR